MDTEQASGNLTFEIITPRLAHTEDPEESQLFAKREWFCSENRKRALLKQKAPCVKLGEMARL